MKRTKVFKFGGASVKSPEAVRNVGRIINVRTQDQLLVVVSAMGKTTNALEAIVSLAQQGISLGKELQAIFDFHISLSQSLLNDSKEVVATINGYKAEIDAIVKEPMPYDQQYDKIVAFGELMSTLIVSAYLTQIDINCKWIDARKYIVTDSHFRSAQIDWENTESNIRELRNTLASQVIITQGFIGANTANETTTLGREGSDFSAAIFGASLDAESVTIWKDVPGVMTADPKKISTAEVFEELPFKEAAEMTYYGASVIHPKTIKPLANKGIPLLVKSFDDVTINGTRIHECKIDRLKPLVVFKENQCLVSCQVTDYTFVDESQIGIIFNALSARNLKINLMQNSAISFSFCLDFEERKLSPLIEELSQHFEVYYNTNLTLVTVKNYDEAHFEKYRNLNGVVLEQSSRSTLQVLVKS